MEKKNEKIICMSFSNGRKHDFRVFKESKVILNEMTVVADGGYRRIQKRQKNVELTHRKTKKEPLTKEKRRRIESL